MMKRNEINSTTSFIYAVAEAIQCRSIEQLEMIESVVTGWAQTKEEAEAQSRLIDSAINVLADLPETN